MYNVFACYLYVSVYIFINAIFFSVDIFQGKFSPLIHTLLHWCFLACCVLPCYLKLVVFELSFLLVMSCLQNNNNNKMRKKSNNFTPVEKRKNIYIHLHITFH